MQPGRSFDLSMRQIHVWTLRTNTPCNEIARFEELLAPDERSRAAQFRVSRPRESFILTRAALRHLIGQYLGQRPSSVSLQNGPHGKPTLSHNSELQFNVTHSGEMAAIALTQGCDIGIDIEQIRLFPDLEQVATRSFCYEEAAEINSLPAGERERAFFACWTRKEAYIKAIGVGLSRPLDTFRVAAKPDASENLLFLEDATNTSESWTLRDLQLGPDYAGAIAYNDRQRSLSIFPMIDTEQFLSIP
jgi:4'-phosphopantetheinyl transferase